MVNSEKPGSSSLAFEVVRFLEYGSIAVLKAIIAIVWSIIEVFLGKEEKSVKNEIVLITGGGNGIGKELSFLYAAQGATVVIWDIDEKNAKETVEEIAQLKYPKAYYYICDVSNYENVVKCAEITQHDVGQVTILINNAGIAVTKSLQTSTHKEIQKLMDVNVMGQFWTLQALLPTMEKANKGHIVALSSMSALCSCENLSAYSASKAAVYSMMNALYHEYRLKKSPIKFTTICPFYVDTPLVTTYKINYPKMYPVLKTEFVAKKIMEAQRKSLRQVSIPNHMQYSYKILDLLPFRAYNYIYDFLGFGVESSQ